MTNYILPVYFPGFQTFLFFLFISTKQSSRQNLKNFSWYLIKKKIRKIYPKNYIFEAVTRCDETENSRPPKSTSRDFFRTPKQILLISLFMRHRSIDHHSMVFNDNINMIWKIRLKAIRKCKPKHKIKLHT